MFFNGRQKLMDCYGMLAKVLVFTHILKAVCDILNEIADVLKIMFFVLQVRTTVAEDHDLLILVDQESSLMKLKGEQI